MSDKKEYPCPDCGKPYKTEFGLKNHIKIKHGDKSKEKPIEKPQTKKDEPSGGEEKPKKVDPFLEWLFPSAAIDNE